MHSGICVDALNPAGCPPAAELMAAGADSVRLVAFDDPAFFAYAGDLLLAGLEVVVVLARESFPTEDYGGFASFYAERVNAAVWVVGNEEDAGLLEPAPSPSSWKMTPQEYAALWNAVAPAIRARQPHAQLCVGGLVSGQPSYLDEVLPLLRAPVPDLVDVHPYGREAASTADLLDLYRQTVGPAEVRALLQAYRAASGLPPAAFVILEWNRGAEEIPGFMEMLRAETGGGAWFCWSSGMVPGFGLIDEQGNKTPEYFAFQEAASMTAIDERAAQLADTLGEPLSEEVELGGGVKLKAFYNGTLVEIPGAGVYALAEATVADKFL